MDDMNAFERQVQRRVHRFVGPARPVDDLAIFEAVTTAKRSPRWGFTMFSALKFVAAGVIVALFGGFLLNGILTTQQGDETTPAAVSASPTSTTQSDDLSHDPGYFTGRGRGGRQMDIADITYVDGTTLSVGARYQMELTEMDDPRLNGTFQVVWNEVTHDGVFNVVTASNRIDNEDGSWIGVERGYDHPRRGWNWQGLYEGQGAYEGLSALLFWEDAGGYYEGHGIVFPGQMPEALEPPAAAAAE